MWRCPLLASFEILGSFVGSNSFPQPILISIGYNGKTLEYEAHTIETSMAGVMKFYMLLDMDQTFQS